MFKHISILVVLTLTLSLASGFMITQISSFSASKMVRNAASNADDDEWKNIIGSEYNIEQYLGQDGWRYRMAKTQDEIKEEGDYTFFQRMFGATSNNKVRLEAREDARVNYEVDSEKQSLNNEWIMKYGYKRFYTSYLDKSQLTEGESEKLKKTAVVAPPSKAKVEKEEKKGGGLPSFSMPSFGKSSSSSAKKVEDKPKANSSRPSVVKATVSKSVESTPVSKPKPQPSAKKISFTVSPVKKAKFGGGNLNLMKSPKK